MKTFNAIKKKKAIRMTRKGFKASRHQQEEFGPGRSEVVLCPVCSAAYYSKSWHHDLSNYSYAREDKNLNFKKCPACQMWAQKQWEGEIRIENLPESRAGEIKRAALGTADQAYRKDPMDRVFDIKKNGKYLVIYTSENQLAMRIMRKLERSFKKRFLKPEIHHGKEGDAFLIKMKWRIIDE